MTGHLARKREAAAAPRSESCSDRWFRLRNAMLSSPRFQRWAARFFLTRFIAKRRANALFDLCAGFVYSQVLYAGVQLGLFEVIADGPRSLDELSGALGLGREACQRLADAAVSLKLLERRPGERYGLGIHGASLIGNPAVASMVRHHELLYRDLADPAALLRGSRQTELGRFWRYVGDERPCQPEEVAGYSALMAGSLDLLAEDLLEAYPVHRHRILLDVAGGEGAFLEAVSRYAPAVALRLFDLPPVAARGAERLRPLGERAQVIAGDVFRDPLPSGADLISLVRVVHDHNDDAALHILRAARTALSDDGTLLVAEPMAGTEGAEPMGAAYFGLYLWAMGQGRPRSPAEIAALIRQAGFARVRLIPTRRPMLTRLLVADGGLSS